jgi:membrane protease subunit HflC
MTSSPRFIALIILFVGSLFVLSQTLFFVHQTQQMIVLQFGEVKRVINEAGLNAKIPFIQNLVVYEKRILDIDPPSFEVLLTDKKRIIVDGYARYRIIDPVSYYTRVRTESRLRDLLGKSINSSLRRVIATETASALLSNKRNDIMAKILSEIEPQSKSFGLDLVDVRIGRTDLPSQTSQAVYSRMRAERERLAREFRAEGEEIARKIRANADKTKVVLISEAEREAEILRGEGEARRNIILAEAFSQDEEFFAFYKSLQAYSESLQGENTSFVIKPDSQFFEYFSSLKPE